jgi:hypothetical protein
VPFPADMPPPPGWAPPPDSPAGRGEFPSVAPLPAPQKFDPACRHRSPLPVEYAACDCREKDVYDCAHPGNAAERCTPAPVNPAVWNCSECGHYLPDPDPFATRHLLYHVLPVKGNGTWQANLDQVKARIGLFNGTRVVAVATKSGDPEELDLDPPAAVDEYLAGYGCEVFPETNDRTLREVATWLPLWRRVKDFARPGHAVFYGHAKAVTRPVNAGVSCHPWTRILYHTLLDYPGLVRRLLARHPIAGSFKKVGAGFQGSKSRWHYSGGMFWVRVADACFRDWRKVDRLWWGTEAWPGIAFSPEEGGVAFHEGVVPLLDAYSPRYWEHTIRPALAAWRAVNRKYLAATKAQGVPA